MTTTQKVLCLGAVAEALAIPDGQFGVTFYLLEALSLLERPDPWHSLALDALSDAIRQDDCQPYHKPLIAKARRNILRLM